MKTSFIYCDYAKRALLRQIKKETKQNDVGVSVIHKGDDVEEEEEKILGLCRFCRFCFDFLFDMCNIFE